jgi:hypothetical protein
VPGFTAQGPQPQSIVDYRHRVLRITSQTDIWPALKLAGHPIVLPGTVGGLMSARQQQLERWLARCRWLQSTRLDDKTRQRLERLIADLERDVEDQKDFESRYRRYG